MTALLTKDLAQEIACSIGDLGLVGESGGAVDENANVRDAIDTLDTTGRVGCGSDSWKRCSTGIRRGRRSAAGRSGSAPCRSATSRPTSSARRNPDE